MSELLRQLQQYAITKSDQPAVIIDDETVTYHEICLLINQNKKTMTSIPKGVRVALCHHNALKNIIDYLTLLSLDCVPCLLDSKWSLKMIRELMNTYHIPFHNMENEISKVSAVKLTSIKDNPTNILHIGFTSGTTGLPKTYYRNEPSWIVSFEQNEILMQRQEKIFVAPGPLSHSLSLYACIYALYTGRTFIGQNHFNSIQLIDKLNTIQLPTAMFLVPTMLHQLLSNHDMPTCLSSIFSSGAKLNKHMFYKLKEQLSHVNLIEFFGTSEASFISYNLNQSAPESSVGKLFSNVDYQIKNKDEEGIGRLYVRSNMTFSGYVNDENELHDYQWISTGDYAHIDEKQCLYLRGRVGSRLIIGGKNVYPAKIESEVTKIHGINEAIVIGQQHDKFGEIAVLLYTGDIELDYRQLKTYLMNKIDRYEIPSKIKKVTKMSYTRSGKISRFEMEKRWNTGELK